MHTYRTITFFLFNIWKLDAVFVSTKIKPTTEAYSSKCLQVRMWVKLKF